MAPLVDPGTDLEDERPTPVGSPLSAVDECMPLSPTSLQDSQAWSTSHRFPEELLVAAAHTVAIVVKHCCHCQWPCRQLGWCLQTLPGSGSLRPGDSSEVVLGPTRTTGRAHRRRRPVCVEEPAIVSVPVLTIQDPLAAVGAVLLDCRPPLLPVSMDIRGVELSAGRLPAMSAGMDGLLPGREPLSNGGGTCWD